MNDQFLTELQNVMGGSGIFMEEPMKKHTTFRVGGPADVLVQPDETALVASLHSADSIMCHILLSEMAVICLWETRESVVW